MGQKCLKNIHAVKKIDNRSQGSGLVVLLSSYFLR